MTFCVQHYTHLHPPHHTTTVLLPFFRDNPGQPVLEENFWTSWCKGRLTEADTPIIRLGATPSRLNSAHLHHPPIYYTHLQCIRLQTCIRVCCHSYEFHAPIANLPNSDQLEGTRYHSPSYIRVCAVVWEHCEGHTDRHTDGCGQYIFRLGFASRDM